MKKSIIKKIRTVFLLILCTALAFTPDAAVLAGEYEEDTLYPNEQVGQDSRKPDGAELVDDLNSDKKSGKDSSKSDKTDLKEDLNSDEQTGKDSGEPDDEDLDSDGQPDKDNGESDDEDLDSDGQPGKDSEEPDDTDPEEDTEVFASVRLTKNKKSVYVKWKRVKGASSYRLQRSSSRKGNFRNIAALEEDSRSYRDKNVAKGCRYFYRVAAKMERGGNCYSDVFSISCPLSQISGVRLIRYSTSSIKVTWNRSKDENTDWYRIYYAKGKSGKYKLAGTTKDNWYRVKELENNQDYYFRVQACVAKKSSKLDSDFSKTAGMKTMPYERTTIFAGDSLTTGLTAYNILNEIAIGGHKEVVAAIGLNTMTFRTRRVFNGRSGLEHIVARKPYRVYIMLGDNDIHYRNKADVIAGYREILKGIRAGSPDTDIVVLAATPVTAAEVRRRSGFAQIPAYNRDLEALAKEMGARYFDCTGFLKDSTGWLKSSYAAGDGVHWQPAAYHEYAKRLTEYDKSLD